VIAKITVLSHFVIFCLYTSSALVLANNTLMLPHRASHDEEEEEDMTRVPVQVGHDPAHPFNTGYRYQVPVFNSRVYLYAAWSDSKQKMPTVDNFSSS
jgi:hypothetical protein